MRKKNLLKLVNGLLALAFLLTAAGGVIRFFAPDVIPYDAFKKFHPLFGLFFVAAAILHIALNFSWIRSNFLKGRF